jgi:hypothetical protein
MADGMGLGCEKLLPIAEWWGSEQRRNAALILRILETGFFWLE